MFSFLVSVEIVVSLLLMVVVLMQSSKGGGLAGTFGGGSVGMVFGVRRTADFLVRATQVLATVFFVLSLVINIFFLPREGTVKESIIQGKAAPQQQIPSTPQLPPTQAPTIPPGGGR
jgi:preprotein translocase subunit SecG